MGNKMFDYHEHNKFDEWLKEVKQHTQNISKVGSGNSLISRWVAIRARDSIVIGVYEEYSYLGVFGYGVVDLTGRNRWCKSIIQRQKAK
jgi:hypothetical protein